MRSIYFFPAPEQLIITHWVEDEEFQLLEHSVSREDLQQLVVLTLDLFSNNIVPETFCQHIKLAPNSSHAKINLTINSSANTLFSASLKELNGGKEVVHGNGNPLTFVQQRDSNITINVAVPKEGSYLLNIYTEEKGCINSKYTCCLSYVITAEHEIE